MKKAFLFVLAVAVIAAFFASGSPDGLEMVAEKLGFIEAAQERASLMTDYSIPAIPERGVSTAFAGASGVFITLSVFFLATLILKKIYRP
jgi:hypothetical protein